MFILPVLDSLITNNKAYHQTTLEKIFMEIDTANSNEKEQRNLLYIFWTTSFIFILYHSCFPGIEEISKYKLSAIKRFSSINYNDVKHFFVIIFIEFFDRIYDG